MQQKQQGSSKNQTTPTTKYVLSNLKQEIHNIRKGMSKIAQSKSHQFLPPFHQSIIHKYSGPKAWQKQKIQTCPSKDAEEQLEKVVKSLKNQISQLKKIHARQSQQYLAQIARLQKENEEKECLILILQQSCQKMRKIEENPEQHHSSLDEKKISKCAVLPTSNKKPKSKSKRRESQNTLLDPLTLFPLYESLIQQLNSSIFHQKLANLNKKYEIVLEDCCTVQQQRGQKYHDQSRNPNPSASAQLSRRKQDELKTIFDKN